MSRVYVGNLDPRVMERDLEDEFRIFGVLRSVWVARRPPGYAFIEFDDRRDAMDAIRELDGKNGWRVELSHNSKGVGGRGGHRGGGEDLKCYECGEPGHFARECRSCIGSWGDGNGRRRSPGPHRRKSPSYGYGRRCVDGAIVHMAEDLLSAIAFHLVMVAATAGYLHIVILVVIHLMLMEIKAGPELSKSGMISMKTICNIVALIGSVWKRDLCYLCSFRDNEVVRTCGFAWLPLCKVFQPLKLHAFATSLHLSAHGFLTIASLHHLFYSSSLLHVVAFSMEAATTFTDIFDDHLSDGLSAKPR
ncbi:hypothetical protein Gotur_002786, partial [Gossypium turneri]